MARLWIDAINKHGGDARLVHLPAIGIRGTTHFLMSDLNNVQIADQVSQFLSRLRRCSARREHRSSQTRAWSST
jgi:hypothetical protein